MHSIAILGAGELAATLARRVAEQELARRVVLVDPDESRARGKALDIAQSGPIEGFDVQVEAAASLAAAGAFEALVVADPPELADSRAAPARASALGESLAPVVGTRVLVVAADSASTVVEAAVRKGMSRERVVGSAPVAYAAALTRRLATEMQVEPGAVSALVLGTPPAEMVVPRESARVGGVPVDRLSAVALRRAVAGLAGRTLGPAALAAAAARVLRALGGPRPSILGVLVSLDGEYGHRRVAVAVPACLVAGRVDSVVEVPLDPVDRVAFDRAAERRLQEAYWA